MFGAPLFKVQGDPFHDSVATGGFAMGRRVANTPFCDSTTGLPRPRRAASADATKACWKPSSLVMASDVVLFSHGSYDASEQLNLRDLRSERRYALQLIAGRVIALDSSAREWPNIR